MKHHLLYLLSWCMDVRLHSSKYDALDNPWRCTSPMPWSLIEIPFEYLVWSRFFRMIGTVFSTLTLATISFIVHAIKKCSDHFDLSWNLLKSFVAEMIYDDLWNDSVDVRQHRTRISPVPVPASSSAQSSASGRSALTASRPGTVSAPGFLGKPSKNLNKSIFLVTIYKSFSLLRSAILQWISLKQSMSSMSSLKPKPELCEASIQQKQKTCATQTAAHNTHEASHGEFRLSEAKHVPRELQKCCVKHTRNAA